MTKTIEDTAGLISIGQLAKAVGVSSRTIRYYEELGILPEPHRSPGGTRKYPSDYQAYIEAALALKDLGFRLEEIKPLAKLALGHSITAGQRNKAARLVDGRIEELARQVAVLRRLRESVRGTDASGVVSAAGTAIMTDVTGIGTGGSGIATGAADLTGTGAGAADATGAATWADLSGTGAGQTALSLVPGLLGDAAVGARAAAMR